MAFVVKNSPPLTILLKNPKCYYVNRKIISQFAKFSSSTCINSTLFTSNSRHHSKSAPCFIKKLSYSNHQSVLPYLSSLHFMSTDNIKTTTLHDHETSSLSTKSFDGDQVIFTNSTIQDSSREVIEPIASDFSTDLSSVVSAADPSLASLGLGSWYTPVGHIQQFLDFLHTSGHLPWWLCIVVVTGVVRLLMMPIFIKTQRNAANLANYMPRMQYYQAKFNESRKSGNTLESSRIANEMMAYMKEHNIEPLKNMIWPLAQAPVFVSFFWALRNMAKLPVESMKVGGFSWVTDLTIPDPYYILPLIASSTLYIILKVGAESGVRMENLKMSKYIVMALPVIIFPFCANFPTAMLFYWCSNNFITLSLVLLFKIDVIRMYFGISKRNPDVIPEIASQKKKGFIASIKESYQDQKILSAIEERGRIDHIRFKKAGTGPIPRTYAYDPTKPRPAVAAKAAGTSSSKVK